MIVDIEVKKVVLVGDARVGKTSLVKYLLNREITNIDIPTVGVYTPTLGVNVNPIMVMTDNTMGNTMRIFDVWEVAGDPRYWSLREGYLVQSDIAIIMYDNVGLHSHVDWVGIVRSVCPTIPIVKCVNHTQDDIGDFSTNASDVFHVDVAHGEGIDALFNTLP